MRNRVSGLSHMSPLLLLVCVWLSCAQQPAPQSAPRESSPWLKKLIAEIQAQPPTNPRSSIWRYTYRGAPVYFRPAVCCDRFSELYDERGDLICYPSGGLAGTGDGKCPDFMNARSNEELVWQDERAS